MNLRDTLVALVGRVHSKGNEAVHEGHHAFYAWPNCLDSHVPAVNNRIAG
jgi:hypothetical protein